jgi:hypothetical protein
MLHTHEAAGSNPVTPTIFLLGCSSVAERENVSSILSSCGFETLARRMPAELHWDREVAGSNPAAVFGNGSNVAQWDRAHDYVSLNFVALRGFHFTTLWKGGIMLDMKKLESTLSLHVKTFAMFRWISKRIRDQALAVSHIHGKLSDVDIAIEWLLKNYDNLPKEIRPSLNEVSAFAHLFVSYLKTSFEFGKNSLRSECGCYCSFCAYVCNAPYLKIRSVSKKSRKTAEALKQLCLDEIAESIGESVHCAVTRKLTSDKSPIASELAMVTYAKELIRRTEYATQGEANYALWREFAWTDGHPNRDFQLTSHLILQAHGKIIAALKARCTNKDVSVQS